MTTLVHSAIALQEALGARDPGSAVAVVMTMGALHEGHAALVRAARERVGESGSVVVTVFVNPLQFGPGEDFDRYPRTLASDVEVCEREGVDVVFAPDVHEVYPRQPLVRVDPGGLADELEGAVRPGHFAGVLTVVLKLLHLVGPDVACFGEKDYQQLVLVQAMVADLAVPVEVVGVPTVRESDGLALSSRNRYLSAAERAAATALSRALRAGADAASAVGSDVVAAARAVLNGEPGVELDYLAHRSVELEEPVPGEPTRLLVAARVGTTRLLDNIAIPASTPASTPAQQGRS